MDRFDDGLPWHNVQDLLGLRVRAFFFDPVVVDARDHIAERLLPVLGSVRPISVHADGERAQYTLAGLVAYPDAVFEHGNGLLCVTDRSTDLLQHEPESWPGQVRGDALVQAVVTALAVAGQQQRPTAALLRCRNVLYQIDPSPAALECLATGIAPARLYSGGAASISVQQLAAYCEPKLRALAGGGDAAAASVTAGGGPAPQCDIAFADTTPSVAGIG